MSLLRRFRSSCEGNTTVMFAIAAVPLLIAAGGAIDIVRMNQTLTVLQEAVDAAAIAGAASGESDQAKIDAIIKDYILANGANDILDSVGSTVAVRDDNKRTFTVRIKGQNKTSLMYLAGIKSNEYDVSSEVKLPGDGLEVVMVLDNTGSMNESGRLPALKNASKKLVADLMKLKDDGHDVKVGIVPFAEYVNVGKSRRSESWMNVPSDSSTTSWQCWNTYPNAAKSNCRQVPNIQDGINMGTYEQCDWDYGTPVQQCGNQTSTVTWNGCVGSRNAPLDEQIGSLSNRYPGLMNAWCNSEILDLTDDKADLDAKLDGMTGAGNTYIPTGLLWGWNMIDHNKPLNTAKSKGQMAAKGGTKAIILMTDGENTISASYPWHWNNSRADADAKTTALCNGIKGDDVVLYTVSFMVTDTAAKTNLINCASDTSKAFTADDSVQLSAAFEEIGASLVAIRVSK
jgi:Flp pilus assembly protein TadG